MIQHHASHKTVSSTPMANMQLNEPSWISDDPASHTIFDMLLSFLSTASTDLSNKRHLVESTVTGLCSVGTQMPSVDVYRFESRVLFAIILTIVKQIAAAASEQDYLVKLVIALRCVPLPANVEDNIDP